MKNILSYWNSIKKELEKKYRYLFLDCDGTLAPIANTPEEARIPKETKEALTSLSMLQKVKLAIISGRSLADIKSVVGLNGIIYVGNHGLEIDGPNITSQWKAAAAYKDDLAEIKTELAKEFTVIPDVSVEDKGLSLCLHYRKADIDEEKVKVIFNRIIDPYVAAGKVSTMLGKKVIEVRPAIGLNKGKIVKWLIKREHLITHDENIAAIYIGDDQTDEQAFKVLGDNDITIIVGNNPTSSAQYYVDDTEQVYQLLTMILNLGRP